MRTKVQYVRLLIHPSCMLLLSQGSSNFTILMRCTSSKLPQYIVVEMILKSIADPEMFFSSFLLSALLSFAVDSSCKNWVDVDYSCYSRVLWCQGLWSEDLLLYCFFLLRSTPLPKILSKKLTPKTVLSL